jgi:hypothetical protein
MKSRRGGRSGIVGFASAFLLCASAQAAPVTYIIDGLAADITVSLDGQTIGGSIASIPIVGQQFVFDAAVPEVLSFAIEVDGGAANAIQLSTPIDIGLGASDQIIIDAAVLTSVVTATYPAIGGGGVFRFMGVSGGGPVAVATSDLILSSGGGPGAPIFGFVSPSNAISGTVYADANSIGAILGFTFFRFQTLSGQLLEAKADILVTGTAVPEPSVAVLFGIAVVAVGARLRVARGVALA